MRLCPPNRPLPLPHHQRPPARKRLPHGRHHTARRIHRQARRRPRQRSLGIQRIGTLAAVAPPNLPAFVQCPSEADSHALSEQSLHTDTYAEDWTSSISFICLRCSYGTPHNHEHHASAELGAWQAERSFGIAARSLADAQALLDDWAAQADGRAVWEIVPQDYPLPRHPESGIWWKNYDEDDE